MKNILSFPSSSRQRKGSFRDHLVPLGILIFLAVATHPAWFLEKEILTHGDWWFDFPEKIKSLFSFPFIWSSDSDLGEINVGLSFWPLQLVGGLMAHFGAEYALIERLLYLWPAALLLVVAPYLLGQWLTGSRLGGFFTAIVYAFNAATIVGETGVITLVLAISIAPLVIYLLSKSLATGRLGYALGAGLAGIWLGAAEFRLLYQLDFCLVLLTGYHLFITCPPKEKRGWRRGIEALLITILVPFGANAYWFWALAQTTSFVSHAVFTRALFGEWLVNLPQAINLFPYLWTGEKPLAFVIQPILFYFYLIPVYAFSSLALHRGNKLRKLFPYVFIALVGILLVKQSGRPFPGLYRWLFYHFPGFNVFRESTKFYFLISLGYAVMVGFTTQKLAYLMKHEWGKRRRFLAAGGLCLMAFSFLVNTSSMMTGKMGTLFVARTQPGDYEIWRKFSLAQPEYFRTLWVPRFSRWSAYSTLHPRLSMAEMVAGPWKRFLIPDQSREDPGHEFLREFFELPAALSLIRGANIRYVVVPIADEANDDDFFPDYSFERETYLDFFEKIAWLKRIELGTHELAVWRVENSRDRFYVAGAAVNFSGSPYQYSVFPEVEINQALDRPVSFELNESGLPSDAWGAYFIASGAETAAPVSGELPFVRYLPTNPFYSFIEMKEAYLYRKAKSGEDKFGLDLLFAGKRLSEIKAMLEQYDQARAGSVIGREPISVKEREEMIFSVFGRYQERLSDLGEYLEEQPLNVMTNSCFQGMSSLAEQHHFLGWFIWETSRRQILDTVRGEAILALARLEDLLSQYCQEESVVESPVRIGKSGRYAWWNGEKWIPEAISLEENIVSLKDFTAILEKAGLSAQDKTGTGQFYLTAEDEELTERKVDWEMIDPTHYRLSVPANQTHFWLVFGESYAPDWKLSWSVPEGTTVHSWHRQIGDWANGWYVELESTGDLSRLEASVEYFPQANIRKGLAATVVMIVFTGVGFCLVTVGNKWRKKKE